MPNTSCTFCRLPGTRAISVEDGAQRVDFADIVIQVKGLVPEALAKNRNLLSAQRLEGNLGVLPKIERCAEGFEVLSLIQEGPRSTRPETSQECESINVVNMCRHRPAASSHRQDAAVCVKAGRKRLRAGGIARRPKEG